MLRTYLVGRDNIRRQAACVINSSPLRSSLHCYRPTEVGGKGVGLSVVIRCIRLVLLEI
jgi:hypothetical protein